VPERDAGDHESAGGLPRLPPGRHGLSREFVVKNQRDRLTAGIIAVVAERGYHEASVSQICAAAGVSRRTFYSYFSSKEECYGEAFDAIGEYLTETLSAAGEAESSWPARVRARLAALLEALAANPDLVRFSLVAPLRAGGQIAARRRLGLERILEVLTQDAPKDSGFRRPSPAVEDALLGGMIALIAHKVERGEGKALPDLLPDLVELYLTPYLGRAEAARSAKAAG
jgi:AcrR family transcriptional regulator